jgi:hypothetical protein
MQVRGDRNKHNSSFEKMIWKIPALQKEKYLREHRSCYNTTEGKDFEDHTGIEMAFIY